MIGEIQQLLDKGLWHGRHVRELTSGERRAIIRSTFFCKDEFSTQNVFEKFKVRLVAGGDQEDHGIYENVSSPTASQY